MIELFTTDPDTIKLANLRAAMNSALQDDDIDLFSSYCDDIRSLTTEIEIKLNNMQYLIDKHKSMDLLKNVKCECCSGFFKTNINRKRCSLKCSKIMKFRRAKENKL
jgi:hypothetical protein